MILPSCFPLLFLLRISTGKFFRLTGPTTPIITDGYLPLSDLTATAVNSACKSFFIYIADASKCTR